MTIKLRNVITHNICAVILCSACRDKTCYNSISTPSDFFKHSNITQFYMYYFIFHREMQTRFHIRPNEQRDIHEIFTIIYSDGEGTEVNQTFASRFHIGSQFQNMCKGCAYFEDGTAETSTSLMIPVSNGINDLEKAVEISMKEEVRVWYATCKRDTIHIQFRYFLFLPQTLVICFTRFKTRNGMTQKNLANLPRDLHQLRYISCHYQICSMALHHGAQIDKGHYNALVLGNNAVLIDDEINYTAGQ